MKTTSSRPYDSVCTIRIGLRSNTSEKLEGSSSGILIDAKHGLVITHASVFYHFAQRLRPGKLDVLANTGSVRGPFFEDKLETEIILPNSSQDVLTEKKNKNGMENPIQLSMLNSGTSDIQSFSRYKGTLKMIFECYNLKRTIERTLPSENWQFVDDTNGELAEKTGELTEKTVELAEKKEENHVKRTAKHEDVTFQLLSSFALFKIKDFHASHQVLSIRDARNNRQGDVVEICATPFGGLSPEVFLNSRSTGIISNLAGPKGVLIMTDARCVPGSEGGALFYCGERQRQLTGIMIASLCWKNNEWVGLSMACAMSELMGSLQGCMALDDDQYLTTPAYTGSFGSNFSENLGKLLAYVHVGHSWGSAVNISPDDGIFLTCSHVLNGMEIHGVTVSHHNTGTEAQCEVIYRTPPQSHFDLAVIKRLKSSTMTNRPAPVHFGRAQEGDVVYVVGHALFRSDHSLTPTVTLGTVSKVVRFNNAPVIMLTTCAVHAGASGGGVFNRLGQLVAIAVCNSKDTVSGACYPHINMCVPMETVAAVIQQYLETNDRSILNSLHIKNKRIQQLWSIGTETAMSRL